MKKAKRKFPPQDRAVYLLIDGSTNHIIGHVFYTTQREADADAAVLREKMPKESQRVQVVRLRHVRYFAGRRRSIREARG